MHTTDNDCRNDDDEFSQYAWFIVVYMALFLFLMLLRIIHCLRLAAMFHDEAEHEGHVGDDIFDFNNMDDVKQGEEEEKKNTFSPLSTNEYGITDSDLIHLHKTFRQLTYEGVEYIEALILFQKSQFTHSDDNMTVVDDDEESDTSDDDVDVNSDMEENNQNFIINNIIN